MDPKRLFELGTLCVTDSAAAIVPAGYRWSESSIDHDFCPNDLPLNSMKIPLLCLQNREFNPDQLYVLQ